MAGSSDGSVEIRITGAIDSSLEASTAQALAQLDELAASAEASFASVSAAIAAGQKSAAPGRSDAGNKAVDAARRSADEIAQIWKQVADKRIEGEEKANSASLALGQESVDEWKSQALAIEKAREDADAHYLVARMHNDAGNTAAYLESATVPSSKRRPRRNVCNVFPAFSVLQCVSSSAPHCVHRTRLRRTLIAQ